MLVNLTFYGMQQNPRKYGTYKTYYNFQPASRNTRVNWEMVTGFVVKVLAMVVTPGVQMTVRKDVMTTLTVLPGTSRR